jgi:hypothetical protein
MKNFDTWLAESLQEENPNSVSAEATALVDLLKLGLVSPEEWIRLYKDIINRGGAIAPDKFPKEYFPMVAVESDLDPEPLEWYKKFIAKWQGAGGVTILTVDGLADECESDLEYVLSNGGIARIKGDYCGYEGVSASLSIGHDRYALSELEEEEADEATAETGELLELAALTILVRKSGQREPKI